MDIKSIIPYVNVASFFVMTALLINADIFLAWYWWVIIPIFIVFSFVSNLPFILLYNNSLKSGALYSLAITLVMTEIMAAVLYLPTSFYVLAAVVALFYYLIIILFKKKLELQLTKKDAVKHFVFIVVLSVIILATSQWT